MKKLFYIFLIIIIFLWGCTTSNIIRYKIISTTKADINFPNPMKIAIISVSKKLKTDPLIESNLLKIIKDNFPKDWILTKIQNADYLLAINFISIYKEEPYTRGTVIPVHQFGSNKVIYYGGVKSGIKKYYENEIQIFLVKNNNKQSEIVWKGECIFINDDGNMIGEQARISIQDILSRFPQSGEWEESKEITDEIE